MHSEIKRKYREMKEDLDELESLMNDYAVMLKNAATKVTKTVKDIKV